MIGRSVNLVFGTKTEYEKSKLLFANDNFMKLIFICCDLLGFFSVVAKIASKTKNEKDRQFSLEIPNDSWHLISAQIQS